MLWIIWGFHLLDEVYKSGGSFSFTLSDSTVLEGYVHSEWMANATDLKITAMDLKVCLQAAPFEPSGLRQVRCFFVEP